MIYPEINVHIGITSIVLNTKVRIRRDNKYYLVPVNMSSRFNDLQSKERIVATTFCNLIDYCYNIYRKYIPSDLELDPNQEH